ncbi:response regulator [Roseomonas fluvialis]|uniref:DNA-binding response regulator n=1 Tax=Roseomonas fluvialis TaxID=1750527 RepID=A0ABN6P8U0_9PROT|nr:response regulator transcription factor [Roseomonas fluvialis]BDG73998.1 DNA-binding response regulator [Roseomonas fluvialis]
MIRVAVVDDHPLFRDGVMQTLRAVADIEVVGEGASAEDAVRISRDLGPDVMLLDMNLSEGGDGIRAVAAITANSPAVRILMLTVVADSDRILEAIKTGVRGYVLKGVGGAELITALRAVHGGETYVTPNLAASLFARLDRKVHNAAPDGAPTMRLSAREAQILSYIAMGISNKEIGQRIELSEKTVKHYVTNLLQKMQVRNRTQAALLASRIQVDRDGAPHSAQTEARSAALPGTEYARPV